MAIEKKSIHSIQTLLVGYEFFCIYNLDVAGQSNTSVTGGR